MARAPSGPPTDLASLRAAKERLAQVDHFAALGVTPKSNGPQIKAAYFALAKAYHPDAAAPGDPPEARQLRADLFARVSEAWAVLGDEAARKKYADDLATGAAAVDVAAILEAENAFSRATVLVKTRQYPQALEELAKAIALNKDEPEFHAWRAWVLFLTAPDQKKQHAASAADIEAALKKLPRCMPGYLFLGLMAKVLGDVAGAERHWKRGLQVDPADPELLKELKYLRK
ncbi:MAG: DnaJ domain-containing protein [Deltaproteobacteria bacterium]|nr:DnaJ domain-containing protein [Deltaproteobacteria bacterium]